MGRHRVRSRGSRRPLTVTAGAVVAAGLCLGGPGVAAAQAPPPQLPAPQIPVPQQAADTGKIRIGHLSPSTPAVDMYLISAGSEEALVARGAGYSAVTPYIDRAPGVYTIAARPAGAPAGSPTVVSATVEVMAGTAQTALFFDTGLGGTVQGQVLLDEEAQVAPGTGLVRIVQGAGGAGPVDATAVGGPALADDLLYGTSTAYTSVPAQPWNVEFSAGELVEAATLDVESGSVNTVVVTRDAAGELAVTPLQDVEALIALPTTTVPQTPDPPEVSEQEAVPPPEASPVPGVPPAPGTPPMPHGGVPAGGGWGADEQNGPLPVAGALVLAVGIVAASARLRGRRHENG